ncbi:MAG: dephospho-CoA kinase, partial [Berryella intestinalis]|nr:dephospho-CoA kinase [Berryella intestinalis]
MRQIFVIGGMGAGKSTARKALVEQGLAYIDLDKVGHEVLTWDVVKSDLVDAFGADILGEDGEVVRAALAQKAFVSPALTRKLNRITLPRI